MRRLLVLVTLLAGGLSAADELKHGTPEEVRADFDLVCNLPERSNTKDLKDHGEQTRKMSAYLLAHLKTEQVTKIMNLISTMDPDKRLGAFTAEAQHAGYTGACPFIEETAPSARLKRGTPEEVRADFYMLCNLRRLSGSENIKDPVEGMTRMGEYLKAHMKTVQLGHVVALLANPPPPDDKDTNPRRTIILDEAKKAGYLGTCPLADEK